MKIFTLLSFATILSAFYLSGCGSGTPDVNKELHFIKPVNGETFNVDDTIDVIVTFDTTQTSLVGVMFGLNGNKPLEFITGDFTPTGTNGVMTEWTYKWVPILDGDSLKNSKVLLEVYDYDRPTIRATIPQPITIR